MHAPQVVFILATNYAGSHLLAHLLAAHSRCAGVGELHNYRKFRRRGSRSGNVVDDYGEHPAFAGLDALPVGAWHPRIFERLQPHRPQLSHLIDNSKRPGWARRFPAASSYAVHLIRDPRALVSRWLRTYENERAWRRERRRVLQRRPWRLLAASDPVEVYVQKWLIGNDAISRFAARRRSALVTYRDLAQATAESLERLMPRLGLHYEPRQLDFGAHGILLGTRKRDYRDAAERSAIELDLRWREHLSAAERTRVERHRGVQRHLSALGLVMTEEGLTAASATGGRK